MDPVVGLLDPLEYLSENRSWPCGDMLSQYSGCCSDNCSRCEGWTREGTKFGRGGLCGGGPLPPESSGDGLFVLLPGLLRLGIPDVSIGGGRWAEGIEGI